MVRLGIHPNGGCACSVGYKPCPFPRRGVRKDRDVIQWWTAFGVRMVITLVLLTFSAVRPHLAFNGYLVITSVLISVGAASACLSDIAGQMMRLCSAAWINPALALYRAGGPTVGQPSADLRPNRDHAVLRAGGGFWTVVGLFALATRRPQIVVGWTSWVIAGCSLLAILTVGQTVGTGFDSLNHPLSVTVTKAALMTTGCCLSATLAVKGRRDSNECFSQPPRIEPAGLVLFNADRQQHEATISIHSDRTQPRPEFLRFLNPRSRQRVEDCTTRSLYQLQRQARWRPAAVEFVNPNDVFARAIDPPAPRGFGQPWVRFPRNYCRPRGSRVESAVRLSTKFTVR